MNRFRFILLISLVFNTLSFLNAQSTLYQKIDSYLKDYQKAVPIPGFSIVVVEGNKITFSKGYGVEQQGKPKPFTLQSPTSIGDMGMSMTALAIMQLQEQGKLKLDDKVIQHLPWFQTANKPFSDLITIRMLLSHSAGIPSRFNSIPNLDYKNALEEFVRSMSSYYIPRKPGILYEFSREGYSVAGLIVEKISGLSYPDYVAKHIFEPLSMLRTTTDPKKLAELNVNYGHEMALTECIPAKKSLFDGNYLPSGSELRSSAEDVGHFLIAMLNAGKYQTKQVINQTSIEEIWKSQIQINGLATMIGGNGLPIGACLGWLKMPIDNRDLILHPGNTRTSSSLMAVNREKKIAIAVLFNADGNRLNQYKYPSMENIGNNILHLLASEPTTDFAIRRFNDPFDDIYKISEAEKERFIGSYIPVGEAHPLFKNYSIEISKGKNDSLELKAFQEGVLKGHFKLQFSAKSRAVLRSIVEPQEIQFKLLPNGSVGGLFMFGSEYKKRDASLNQRFSTQTAASSPLSFLFPNGWKTEWSGTTFTAQSSKNPNIQLKMEVLDLEKQSFQQFSESVLSGQNILTKGVLKKEGVNDGVWIEQTIFTKNNSQNQQHLLAFYQDPNANKQLQIQLTFPSGSFSSELQEMMMYFQKTVHF